MFVVESEGTKAWFVGKPSNFIVNLYRHLPDRKRFVSGQLFFEITRSNIETILNTDAEIEWHGPIKEKVEEYKSLAVQEEVTLIERRDNTEISIDDHPFKTKPYDHQKKAFALARGKEYFGYFMEQGTGKTKTLLDDFADIALNGGEKGPIDSLLIIAPNGVHAQWILEQLVDHLPECVEYDAAYTTAYPNPEEKAALANLKKSKKFKILAAHIDTMSNKKGQKAIIEFLDANKCFTVIDESSKIKNEKSKRTDFALKEIRRRSVYRRILTGTPVTQGVEDLYSQLNFLSPDILGFSSFYAFRNSFCRMGGFQNKKIVGYINQDILTKKIDSHTFRVTKDECLDLPERIYVYREVPLHPEQKEVYNKLKKEFFLEIDGEPVTFKMAMTRLTRLHQLLNGFIHIRQKKNVATGEITTPETMELYHSNRVQAVLDIIAETSKERKFIIWVKYQMDHTLLTEALDKAGIGWVDYVGLTKQEDREPNIQKFRNDPDTRVFISTPASGGTGLNLTVASEVIWFTRSFSLEDELQANDRCHRIGQKLPVTYYYLRSSGTIDDKIDMAQKTKKNVATSLIDIREMIDE